MKVGTLKYNQTAPPKRGGASFFYHKGSHLLIGGGDSSTEYNDIWDLTYEPNSHEPTWKNIKHKGAISYTPRTGQAGTLCKDQIFIFGGQNYHDAKLYGDGFLYDIENNSWETLTSQNKPEDRNSCTACYDKVKNRIILIGGANGKGPLDDVHIYNIESKTWEKPEIKETLKPLAREMHSAVIYYGKIEIPEIAYQPPQTKKETTIDLNFVSDNYVEKKETVVVVDEKKKEEEENKQVEEESKLDTKFEELSIDKKEESDKTGYLILMGGRYIDQISQEILCLNLETFEWSYLGEMPVKLCSHAWELVGDKIFVFGGTDGLQLLDSLYYFDIPTKKWYIYAEKTDVKLLPRIAASLSYNPDNDELVFFGGCSYEDFLNNVNFLSVSSESLNKFFQKY